MDIQRLERELLTAFHSLNLDELVAIGRDAVRHPKIRGASLEFASWVTNICKSEFDSRQGLPCDETRMFEADAIDDGALAGALAATMTLSHGAVTEPMDNFTRALERWLVAHAILRLQCRHVAMSN